ncbi:MAG: UDP-glucose 4-epimerase GalE [Gammaproteobacteria bacterium RIFCSPHIGHO2_12_FULL_45_12]|nr:MAG: UDP-glucose 4-epimerase GalE [Gammaproteobacteria bacterium RIFCSPHIGHO2_12_FULL_45_12]
MPIKSRSVLVVGGAGYIGSHMVLGLRNAGYRPVVLDNLSKGHADAVIGAELVVGNMDDSRLLTKLFAANKFLAVMHFASLIEVAESVSSPIQYYKNNVTATLCLLEHMLKNGVNHFIFSSSAAVYGDPRTRRMKETHPLMPINPYGRSKLMVEGILKDLEKSHALQYAVLRYFNAAGADPEGRIGERHSPETHLIPLLLQVAAGLRRSITIHGNHYPTPDGTCIRDYVHVSDICSAHLMALQAILKGKKGIVCNLGTGKGYSVLQVINAVRRVTGRNIMAVNGNFRPGDAAVLVADATLAKELLNWKPNYADLHVIIQHAWSYVMKSVYMEA